MRKTFRLVCLLLVACAAMSCEDWCHKHEKEYDHVVLLYSLGFNSLSNYLSEDISNLKDGFVPSYDSQDVLLIYSHLPVSYMAYSAATSPVLIRMYTTGKKTTTVVMDTLKVYSVGTVPTQKGQMRSVLTTIDSLYHASSYGMIYSSHGTGWIPSGYYDHPDTEYFSASPKHSRRVKWPEGAVPAYEGEPMPGPAVKSVGQTIVRNNGTTWSYESELTDFAQEFPYRFDYIILDACLMGGVETAWQMKNVTKQIAFSQTEVLADGLDYPKVANHLFCETPDLKGICEDYFSQYSSQSGDFQSATFSLVDCEQMSDLAEICRSLFSKYRSQIADLNADSVQRYYRSYHHWYFDLEDILVKAGITDSERAQLEKALGKCVTFKAATDSFMPNSGGFKINSYSGLSMYLPNMGSESLDLHYKTLSWNQYTGLVQ